jgi:hypothetical protein
VSTLLCLLRSSLGGGGASLLDGGGRMTSWGAAWRACLFILVVSSEPYAILLLDCYLIYRSSDVFV